MVFPPHEESMEGHIRFDTKDCALLLLDQRRLPLAEETFACHTVDDVVYALRTMVVRGAPAIGVSAAYACRIALKEALAAGSDWTEALHSLLDRLVLARPTAVNLAWAVNRMRAAWKPGCDPGDLARTWEALALEIHAEDVAMNRAMGRFGAELLDDGDTVMTHCNAGALATGGHGTALGVIRSAVEAGKKISVIANETRPFLQGARLTAYELHRDGIPVTVACDNACSQLMKTGRVQKVVVGADRIAANGDTANKIGTSGVALLARHYGIPFYVAAPGSTFDLSIPDGSHIPIEERTPEEVTHVGGTRVVPEGVSVVNEAFDVTESGLITGIVTEKGVIRPDRESILRAMGGAP